MIIYAAFNKNPLIEQLYNILIFASFFASLYVVYPWSLFPAGLDSDSKKQKLTKY